MAGELDSIRPVHPPWPGRSVREQDDEHKRHREPDEQGSGEGPPDDPAPDPAVPAPDDPNTPQGGRPRPADDGAAGHHVDEYV